MPQLLLMASATAWKRDWKGQPLARWIR